MTTQAGVARVNRDSRGPSWEWQKSADCRGEDLMLFFAPEGERPREREIRESTARRVCSWCPVRTECLDYAMSRPEQHGFWGGLNEDERAVARRRRMRQQAQAARTKAPTADARDLELYRRSEQLVAAGETIKSAARRMGVPHTSLRSARQRAREILADMP